jgi:hypothetical protein
LAPSDLHLFETPDDLSSTISTVLGGIEKSTFDGVVLGFVDGVGIGPRFEVATIEVFSGLTTTGRSSGY